MAYNTDKTKHRDNYKKWYDNDNKERIYVHDKFTLELDKIRVSCSSDGKLTLVEDHSDDTFDEITIPASLVFKIAMMLEATRKINWIDKVKA